MNRENLGYIEEAYENFKTDPNSVSDDWRRFFQGFELGLSTKSNSGPQGPVALFTLAEAYRNFGHLKANINPLKAPSAEVAQLDPKNFGFKDINGTEVYETELANGSGKATLKQIIEHLEKKYCGTLSVELAGVLPDERKWFIDEIEHKSESLAISPEMKKQLLGHLVKTDSFEKFVHSSFVGAKRFSIEGADSIVPMLEWVVANSQKYDFTQYVYGMAHRGRLNVLTHVLGQPLEFIFAQFEGQTLYDTLDYDGDVKYHLGYHSKRQINETEIGLDLAFNPSHLEAVGPIVLGIVRAKQEKFDEPEVKKRFLPLLIHGDAAFIGQGVVSESLQMFQLPAYQVGGTIHVILNNQVGFTTDPKDARSTPHPSDLARSIFSPVIHVNGDDLEACVRAIDLAVRYRQTFQKDVVINLVCYRRFGHNEGDEPAFTQPLMYEKIRKHPTPLSIYSKKLMDSGIVTEAEVNAMLTHRNAELQAALERVREKTPKFKPNDFQGAWAELRRATEIDFENSPKTAVSKKILQDVGNAIVSPPEGFNVHPKLQRLVARRADMIAGKEKVDWGMAELLAYGSLVHEEISVRLTGQDCVRGTFSHRHSVYFDTKTGNYFNPFDNIKPGKAECRIYNSLLSEFAAMAFEYGISITDPKRLTVWEAQFGDFVNGAQIIIDQFLSAGETKWLQMSGLVLFLPHGYEGQGPEHSSARLERFLQLCAQQNIQVVNLTTPAQIFHCLRRQMHRDFRKPLIVMSPKSLLRHPMAVSSIEEFSSSKFEELLTTNDQHKPNETERVIFCSGKLYFELLERREQIGASKTEIVRVEQLYPFPDKKIKDHIKSLNKLKDIVWAQEEPHNMGARFFAMPRLKTIVSDLGLSVEVKYSGRKRKASPATGNPKQHAREQEAVLSGCFE
ncbi:MAG: 2-oxoglutarate dehydrogenase subunit E1 [Bdellovibrionales bacterium CG10_big_fil_rev_8_21_14_0_10_45_34]|nr:MAG: 2-oxoglutarate dehydrogenase subunit E1 [Bdellovibrionales bacterium CG10_big_fil_rev_8_21_14_0_10_45_34]